MAQTVNEDGSISHTTATQTTNQDGSYTSESTTTNQDGSSSTTNSIGNADGSSETHGTSYDSNGDPTDAFNNEIDTSGNSSTQTIEYENGEPVVSGTLLIQAVLVQVKNQLEMVSIQNTTHLILLEVS